jgi:F-type H+-transporting ATPase subunit delta
MMNAVCTRYAEALVDIAFEKELQETYEKDLAGFVELLEDNEELLAFLQNKMIGRDVKKILLKELLEGRVDKTLVNFVLLLLDKERITLSGCILSEYKRLRNERANILNLTIYSADKLSKEQTDKIREKYMKMYNAEGVKADVVIDKKLLGGIKIKTGSRVEDASLKGRLEGLKELFGSQE